MELNEKARIIGLTGMSGAGKTTACEVFRECGFAVIDCDKTARSVVEAGKPALGEIAARFGKEYLSADGTLDRRRLGTLVFSSEADRMALNEIIYPYISYDIIREMTALIENGEKYILLDAPTLFESGTDDLCGAIVSVTAENEACIARIMERDSLTREQARDRVSSQHTKEFFMERSDHCIINDGTPDELRARARRTAETIRKGDEGR